MNVGRLDGIVYRRANRGTTITVSNPTIQSSQVEVKIPDGYYLDNCGLVLPNSVLATALGIKATDIASGKSILGVIGTLTTGKRVVTGSANIGSSGTGQTFFPLTIPISPGFNPSKVFLILSAIYSTYGGYGRIVISTTSKYSVSSTLGIFTTGTTNLWTEGAGGSNQSPAVILSSSSTNLVLSVENKFGTSSGYITGQFNASWTLIE